MEAKGVSGADGGCTEDGLPVRREGNVSVCILESGVTTELSPSLVYSAKYFKNRSTVKISVVVQTGSIFLFLLLHLFHCRVGVPSFDGG